MGGGAGTLGTVAADDCDIDVLDPFRSGSMLMKRSRGCGRWIKGMGGGAGAFGTVAADDCEIDVLDCNCNPPRPKDGGGGFCDEDDMAAAATAAAALTPRPAWYPSEIARGARGGALTVVAKTSLLQIGHDACRRSHSSTQSTWNVWPATPQREKERTVRRSEKEEVKCGRVRRPRLARCPIVPQGSSLIRSPPEKSSKQIVHSSPSACSALASYAYSFSLLSRRSLAAVAPAAGLLGAVGTSGEAGVHSLLTWSLGGSGLAVTASVVTGVKPTIPSVSRPRCSSLACLRFCLHSRSRSLAIRKNFAEKNAMSNTMNGVKMSKASSTSNNGLPISLPSFKLWSLEVVMFQSVNSVGGRSDRASRHGAMTSPSSLNPRAPPLHHLRLSRPALARSAGLCESNSSPSAKVVVRLDRSRDPMKIFVMRRSKYF